MFSIVQNVYTKVTRFRPAVVLYLFLMYELLRVFPLFPLYVNARPVQDKEPLRLWTSNSSLLPRLSREFSGSTFITLSDPTVFKSPSTSPRPREHVQPFLQQSLSSSIDDMDAYFFHDDDMITHSHVLRRALQTSKPIVWTRGRSSGKGIDHFFQQLQLPINVDSSCIEHVMVDTFSDRDDRMHYRVIQSTRPTYHDTTFVLSTYDHPEHSHINASTTEDHFLHTRQAPEDKLHSSFMKTIQKKKIRVPGAGQRSAFYESVRQHIQQCRTKTSCMHYMAPLLEQKSTQAQRKWAQERKRHDQNSPKMQGNMFTPKKESSSRGSSNRHHPLKVRDEDNTNMVPPPGAQFRAYLVTDFHEYLVNWTEPVNIIPQQIMGTRMDISWFVYLEGLPQPAQYHVIALLDGAHNPNIYIDNTTAKGFFLSSFEVKLGAQPLLGVDPARFYWRRSRPQTVNARNVVGRSNTVTDTQQLNMMLQLQTTFNEPFYFNNVQIQRLRTFQATFTHTRDITDWALVENTEPVNSTAKWRYHQAMPVDMAIHTPLTFALDGHDFEDQKLLREIPYLSKATFQTHQSAWWTADASLAKKAANSTETPRLDVQFSFELPFHLTALAYLPPPKHHDRHPVSPILHMAQIGPLVQPVSWKLNLADLSHRSTEFDS